MKDKKYSLLEIIGSVTIILSFPGIIVTFVLASNNMISAGIPIINFGVLFILIPLFGKDTDNSLRNQKRSKVILITLGLEIIAIGISIIYKSIVMFIYSFIHIFGITGLSLAISLIYTYLYNKKYCTKKISAICSSIIGNRNYDNIDGHYYETTRPVFTIRNEDGTKKKELIYDISSHRLFIIGQTYELMVNPKNYNEFYILGDNFFKGNLIPIIIASIFITFSIIGNFIILTSNWQ